MALKNFHDLLFGHRADNLIGHLPALEDQQSRDATNAEFSRDVHILIDVELHYLELARMFARNFFHRGRQHEARAAPVGPEINHYRLGLAGFDHVHLKAGVAYCLNRI